MTLAVTKRASERMKELLDEQNDANGQVLRLSPDGQGGLGLSLDEPKSGDQIVEHQGDTVMVLEPSVSDFLDQRTLDLTEDGSAFTLVG